MVRNNPGDTRGKQSHVTDTSKHDATRESLIGTDHHGRSNISWGAIIAGVMTFLAVTVLLSLVTAGIGLAGSGIGAAIWSIVTLLLALLAAGFVAGALSVRSGLLHGFLTWATSLVVALALTVWLGASVLGAVGGIANTVASSAGEAVSITQIDQLIEDVRSSIQDEDVDQAQETLDEAGQAAADTAQASAWWGFVGLLLGAIVAAVGGMLGTRTVVPTHERETTRVTTTR
ncbi:DUF4199 domain-containing protein [Microbacterium sp. LRZ72]|uniref:DUF4199 domain-containing protein n=1 Tax=Microbacterium sp. LRZ72 TaxID=2942481 RepID=UPI0029BCE9C2|nr:DUF4199 domain-containing protein [Microbacterium sp. LRZ72]MDX2378051.1 DUF4199 domain-containing protein [Microbacterium sp. LRZ72]